jgi:hypothetical protein
MKSAQEPHALGLDPRVDTGSPSENATKKEKWSEARFNENGLRSTAFPGAADRAWP